MMGKWECSKCLEDNSDSEELCQWCDTLRDEADPARIRAQSQRRDGSPELQTKPENSDSNGCVEAAWALRRQRLLKELAEVDWCAPEERRSRLRALQLELHPDKHQQGAAGRWFGMFGSSDNINVNILKLFQTPTSPRPFSPTAGKAGYRISRFASRFSGKYD